GAWRPHLGREPRRRGCGLRVHAARSRSASYRWRRTCGADGALKTRGRHPIAVLSSPRKRGPIVPRIAPSGCGSLFARTTAGSCVLALFGRGRKLADCRLKSLCRADNACDQLLINVYTAFVCSQVSFVVRSQEDLEILVTRSQSVNECLKYGDAIFRSVAF